MIVACSLALILRLLNGIPSGTGINKSDSLDNSAVKRNWFYSAALFGFRGALYFVLSFVVAQSAVLVALFVLAILFLPIISSLWMLNKFIASFFIYQFILITTIIFYILHIQSIDKYIIGWDLFHATLLTTLIGLFFAVPIGIWVIYLVKTLPNGSWAIISIPLLIVPFALIGTLSIGLSRSLVGYIILSISIWIGAVAPKIITEKREIVSETEEPTAQEILWQIIDEFIQASIDLFGKTILGLVSTTIKFLQRIMIPALLVLIGVVLMVGFEYFFILYHWENQYGVLLILYISILLTMFSGRLSYYLLFEDKSDFNREIKQIRKDYKGILAIFIVIYPFTVLTLYFFGQKYYDLFDPMFVATTSIVLAYIVGVIASRFLKIQFLSQKIIIPMFKIETSIKNIIKDIILDPIKVLLFCGVLYLIIQFPLSESLPSITKTINPINNETVEEDIVTFLIPTNPALSSSIQSTSTTVPYVNTSPETPTEIPNLIELGQVIVTELNDSKGDIWNFLSNKNMLISIAVYGSGLDTIIELYDDNSNLVIENDDGLGMKKGSLIENYNISKDGIYTIRIRSFDDNIEGNYIIYLAETKDFCLLTSASNQNVNIRISPSLASRSVGRVRPNEIYPVTGINNNRDWYFVEDKVNDVRGWVSSSYIDFVNCEAELPILQ